jgi:hypothetical protein
MRKLPSTIVDAEPPFSISCLIAGYASVGLTVSWNIVFVYGRFLIDSKCSVGAKQIQWGLPFLEIARVLLRFDHVASIIVNANHCVM